MNPSAAIYPRRQLGPDSIKSLRDISKQMTGDRFSYDGCRVQLDRYGNPAMTVSPEHMRWIGRDDSESYGHLISEKIIPTAEKIATELGGATQEARRAELQRLLRKAHKWDREVWWLLSAASLRSLLFPAAYTDGKRRIDNVRYVNRPKDFHNSRVIALPELSESSMRRFTESALRLTNKRIDPRHITPISKLNER